MSAGLLLPDRALAELILSDLARQLRELFAFCLMSQCLTFGFIELPALAKGLMPAGVSSGLAVCLIIIVWQMGHYTGSALNKGETIKETTRARVDNLHVIGVFVSKHTWIQHW